MANPRKPTAHQRLRHRMLSEWRGVEDGPLIDLPVKQAGDVLMGVLKDLGISERMQLERVMDAWQAAAGEFNARHGRPESISRGVLMVRVVNSSAMHALSSIKPVLLARLNERLGTGLIKDLRFRV